MPKYLMDEGARTIIGTFVGYNPSGERPGRYGQFSGSLTGTLYYDTEHDEWYLRRADASGIFQDVKLASPPDGVTAWEFVEPSGVEDVPKRIWPHLTGNPPMLSYHIGASSWIRVTAFLDSDGGSLEVPLLINGEPVCDPAIPPAIFSQRHNYSTTDRVTAPGANAVQWNSAAHFTRPNSGTTATSAAHEVVVIPKRDPVPHWVLNITTVPQESGAPQSTVNFMVDLVTNSFGTATGEEETGSSGTAGHYQVWRMWANDSFDGTGDLATVNDRHFEIGAIDVAEGSTTGTIYTTTGASQGTSSGTLNVGGDDDDIPAVMVQGHEDLTSANYVASLTGSNWKPETWGHEVSSVRNTALGRSKMYQSTVEKDTTSGKWKVNVTNLAPASAGSYDRTFFVWILGRT